MTRRVLRFLDASGKAQEPPRKPPEGLEHTLTPEEMLTRLRQPQAASAWPEAVRLEPNPEQAKRIVRNDWHAALPGEPPCGKGEWRTKDRMVVMKIADMDDNHLMHVLRFTREKHAHRWKHREVVAEWEKRNRAGHYDIPF